MTTAFVSALTGIPVKASVAMTGEITLRGLVLPIGGLKEKTLAAKRAGIKQVIVPKRNEKDMPDVPEEVRNTLKFHFVENVDQVLEIALGARVRSKPAAKPTPGKAANGERHKRPVVRTPGAAARS
jgi:ATP-dependent Lon protease